MGGHSAGRVVWTLGWEGGGGDGAGEGRGEEEASSLAL
jgi:hypothetical protein